MTLRLSALNNFVMETYVDGRTHTVTPYAPVRAKKHKVYIMLTIIVFTLFFM